jgi:hypothetical protein
MGICMNQVSYVPCGCKAILDEKDPRAAIWKAVFGCLEFPLKSPLSHFGEAEGEFRARFFMGDWEALSLQQQNELINQMREKFKVNMNDFADQLNTLHYIPIKDVNINVLVCQLHTRVMV